MYSPFMQCLRHSRTCFRVVYCTYLDNNQDTLDKEIVNDELIVSNDKATPLYIFVFVQDKVEVVNADANRCIAAQLVKPLLPPLGASKVFP